MSALAQPDFSKIDCRWECLRLTRDPVEFHVLAAIVGLSVLDVEYRPDTRPITTRRLQMIAPYSVGEICRALVALERRKVITIRDARRGKAVVITPLLLTWKSLPSLRNPKGLVA